MGCELLHVYKLILSYRSTVKVDRFEKFSPNFNFVVCNPVLIFSILNHPGSFMVYHYLFYLFQVSFNLTVILSMVKITQNTVTVPL